MQSNRIRQKGFTLVELMLAMAFFSGILFISAAAFVQMLGIYNKGVAVKQMNQAGRTLTDSIIRSANGSSSQPKAVADANGRIHCISLGTTVYIWSYVDDEATPAADAYRYDSTELVNFARYKDTVGGQCPAGGSNPSDYINRNDISPVIGGTLRVYDMKIGQPVNGTVRFEMSLGTFAGVGAESNATMTPQGLNCPADSLGNFCAFSNYKTVLFVPASAE